MRLPSPLIARFVIAMTACAVALVASTTPVARAAPADDSAVSVLTLNIYHDRDHWPQRLPLILDGLRALDPDIIALQEVLQHETLPNQARTIADTLGYQAYFVSVDPPGAVKRYGNAILTRDPVLARSWKRLRPYDDARTVAHVRVAVDGRSIDVYATHLHHTQTVDGADKRSRQLRDLLVHVAATGDGSPVLLMGDFNASADAAELAPLREGYVNTWTQANRSADGTVPATTTLNPHYFDSARRIDHVFVQRGRFDVCDATVVLDRAGAEGHWPSDHFGLLVRLRLTPSAAVGERSALSKPAALAPVAPAAGAKTGCAPR